MKDFSRRLKPVYKLLKVKSDKKGVKTQIDSKVKINWTAEHQKVIQHMVDYLNPEVISYPDFSIPFIVHCDASQDGLGAVLYQKHEGKPKVVSFASRTLSTAEKNYFSTQANWSFWHLNGLLR